MSIIIGLTGPSGAGKSTVCESLAALGCTVINADSCARAVTSAGSPCLDALKKAFGSDIVDNDGALIRSVLAARAFSSKESTQLLDSITHPYIIDLINKKIESANSDNPRAIILDAPQLFEAKADKLCKICIGLLCNRNVRINRIMTRDGIDADAAERRMNAAHDDSYFISHCNAVFYNDGSEASPHDIAQKILALAEKENG